MIKNDYAIKYQENANRKKIEQRLYNIIKIHILFNYFSNTSFMTATLLKFE